MNRHAKTPQQVFLASLSAGRLGHLEQALEDYVSTMRGALSLSARVWLDDLIRAAREERLGRPDVH